MRQAWLDRMGNSCCQRADTRADSSVPDRLLGTTCSVGFPSGGSPHGGDPHLHEQVQLAQVIVTAGGRVSAHHVLAVDVGVGEHVLAGGQAQAVLGVGRPKRKMRVLWLTSIFSIRGSLMRSRGWSATGACVLFMFFEGRGKGGGRKGRRRQEGGGQRERREVRRRRALPVRGRHLPLHDRVATSRIECADVRSPDRRGQGAGALFGL